MAERRKETTTVRAGDRIHSEAASPGTPEAAHELTDATPAPIARLMLLLVVLIALAAVASNGLLLYYRSRIEQGERPPHPLAAEGEIPPPPRLQTFRSLDEFPDTSPEDDPFSDEGWVEHRQRVERELSSYGWVDRPNGVVRVPVLRAEELVLREGLPTARPSGAPKEQGR
jgi:hypothetical protein